MPSKNVTDYPEKLIANKDLLSLSQNRTLRTIAEAVSTKLVIINSNLQIEYANTLFLQFLKVDNLNQIIGKQPGEAFACISKLNIGGKPEASGFCESCGLFVATMEAAIGKKSEKECHITTCNNETLDLRIAATPFVESGIQYTLFSVKDISYEKRKTVLERVFFHDVLNTAGGISALARIMKEISNPEEIQEIAHTIAISVENMIDTIHAQQNLSAAESGDIKMKIEEINSLAFMCSLISIFSNSNALNNVEIVPDENSANSAFFTDRGILRRILVNMIKNAVEASLYDGKVTISCKDMGNSLKFSVHNQTFMDEEIQHQLFQRSFSTKGEGRGIGTYSMKLLGEKYLKGKVWFESSVSAGTFFYISIPKNLLHH